MPQSDTPVMSYIWVCSLLGDGDIPKGREILFALGRRFYHARGKHPVFAEGPYHALGEVGKEYQELVQAVEHESEERQRDESLDLAVTALRNYAQEYKIQNAHLAE